MTSVVELLLNRINIVRLWWDTLSSSLWWTKFPGRKDCLMIICKCYIWLLETFIWTLDSSKLHSSWLGFILVCLVLHDCIHQIQLISQMKLHDNMDRTGELLKTRDMYQYGGETWNFFLITSFNFFDTQWELTGSL